nr:hypothetical protein [Halorussus halobius]
MAALGIVEAAVEPRFGAFLGAESGPLVETTVVVTAGNLVGGSGWSRSATWRR